MLQIGLMFPEIVAQTVDHNRTCYNRGFKTDKFNDVVGGSHIHVGHGNPLIEAGLINKYDIAAGKTKDKKKPKYGSCLTEKLHFGECEINIAGHCS